MTRSIRRCKPRDHLPSDMQHMPAGYIRPRRVAEPFHKALWRELARDRCRACWWAALAVLVVVVVMLTGK